MATTATPGRSTWSRGSQMFRRLKQPKFSKGQRVRVWVGDEFVIGTVVGWTRVGSDNFQYKVAFSVSPKVPGTCWQHDMEAEDAVTRLGGIV